MFILLFFFVLVIEDNLDTLVSHTNVVIVAHLVNRDLVTLPESGWRTALSPFMHLDHLLFIFPPLFHPHASLSSSPLPLSLVVCCLGGMVTMHAGVHWPRPAWAPLIGTTLCCIITFPPGIFVFAEASHCGTEGIWEMSSPPKKTQTTQTSWSTHH